MFLFLNKYSPTHYDSDTAHYFPRSFFPTACFSPSRPFPFEKHWPFNPFCFGFFILAQPHSWQGKAASHILLELDFSTGSKMECRHFPHSDGKVVASSRRRKILLLFLFFFSPSLISFPRYGEFFIVERKDFDKPIATSF